MFNNQSDSREGVICPFFWLKLLTTSQFCSVLVHKDIVALTFAITNFVHLLHSQKLPAPASFPLHWPSDKTILVGRKANKYRSLKPPILLLEGVGPSAPPGQEHGQADGLQDLGRGTDRYGVDRSLLSQELRKVLRAC